MSENATISTEAPARTARGKVWDDAQKITQDLAYGEELGECEDALIPKARDLAQVVATLALAAQVRRLVDLGEWLKDRIEEELSRDES